MWPSVGGRALVALFLLLCISWVECAITSKASALASLGGIDNLDIRFTFEAADTFDTVDLRYAADPSCPLLSLDQLDFASRVYLPESGQTLSPLSVTTFPSAGPNAVFLSVSYSRAQTEGAAGSGVIAGTHGAVPLPDKYAPYNQLLSASLTYDSTAPLLLRSCMTMERRLAGTGFPAGAPDFYPYARRGLWATYVPGALSATLRVALFSTSDTLLLPIGVRLALGPALAAAAAGTVATLAVAAPAGDDVPFAGSVSATLAADGTVYLPFTYASANTAPLVSGVVTLSWNFSVAALTAMAVAVPLAEGSALAATLLFPGGLSTTHSLLYPFAFSPAAVVPQPLAPGTRALPPAGSVVTQLSLNPDEPAAIGTRACQLQFTSNISLRGPSSIELYLAGFPGILRLGLDAAQPLALRLCEHRAAASGTGALRSLFHLFSFDPENPDSCSFTAGRVEFAATAVRVTSLLSGLPLCVHVIMPPAWHAAILESAAAAGSEYGASTLVTCSFRRPESDTGNDAVFVLPQAGGAVSLELVQNGPPLRSLALQQTCALLPLPPVRFVGPRAHVMFTLPRSDDVGGVKMVISATTTQVRSGLQRLAIRLAFRDLAVSDIDPTSNGVRNLLATVMNRTCSFVQAADAAQAVAPAAVSADSSFRSYSGTYTPEHGFVLPPAVDIADTAPWTVVCNAKRPNETLSNEVPTYGVVDGLAVELFSCTTSGSFGETLTCGENPIAVSRPPSETGRDVDSFADAEWEANPARISLMSGTGPYPLRASIVRNVRNTSRGSVNVPFAFVAERHLEEHPVRSIGLTVDLLNVFALGSTPRCLLMDPLSPLTANGYIPFGSYLVAFTSDTLAYPSFEGEPDRRTRLNITGFPPARVNALIVLTCTGDLHAPADEAVARAAVIEATIEFIGIFPVVLSLSHIGVSVQGHSSPSKLHRSETSTLGYARDQVLFARPEMTRQSERDSTYIGLTDTHGLSMVMVMLNPLSPTAGLTSIVSNQRDDTLAGLVYTFFTVGPELCKVRAPSLVYWSGITPTSLVERQIGSSAGNFSLYFSAETFSKPYEGGAIVVRCETRNRIRVYTPWKGNPWQETSANYGFFFDQYSLIYSTLFGSSNFRFALSYDFESPYSAQSTDLQPFFVDPPTFHVPTAALARETALIYAQSNLWPPPGRSVCRFPHFAVHITRKALHSSALSSAQARRFSGAQALVRRRVTVILTNSGFLTFGGSSNTGTSANHWALAGTTVAQIALLLERRYPASAAGVTDFAAIERSSVRVHCVSPSLTVYDVTTRDVLAHETSIASILGRDGVYSSPFASVMVQIGTGFSIARGLGDCAVAHAVFTVLSVASAGGSGAYDTPWRARAIVQTHFDTELVDVETKRRTPSYVYQFVEAVPPVDVVASAPVGALYTQDSVRSAATESTVIAQGVNTLLTIDLLGLNSTDEHTISVFLPPSLVPIAAECTAAAYFADRMTSEASQELVVAASGSDAGPLGVWLNLTIATFTPLPASYPLVEYRHSLRLQCPYTLADASFLRRSRAPIPVALYFSSASWSGPQARLLLLPPLISRQLRATSVHSAATVAAWPPSAWTSYAADFDAWLDLQITSEDGTSEDADLAGGLDHLTTVARGLSLAPRGAFFAKHGTVHNAGSALTVPLAITLPSAFAADDLAQSGGFDRVRDAPKAFVGTATPLSTFLGALPLSDHVTPRLSLADADVFAGSALSCGAFDCGTPSQFRIQSLPGASCGPISDIDPYLSIAPTLRPLMDDLDAKNPSSFFSASFGPFPHGSNAPYYCVTVDMDVAVLPFGHLACVHGIWTRTPANGKPSASCPAVAACDPLRPHNVDVFVNAGAHIPDSLTAVAPTQTLSSHCLVGRANSAGSVATFECQASGTFALAAGTPVCGLLCPALTAAQSVLAAVSYSATPVTISTNDTAAPLTTGYLDDATVSVTCAQGTVIIFTGPGGTMTQQASVACDETLGKWAESLGASLPCQLLPVLCPILTPLNGFASASADASAVTYSCNAGYEFSGSHHARRITHHCTGDADPPGTPASRARYGWSGVLPSCVLVPMCAVADLFPDYFAVAASFPGLAVRPLDVALSAGSPYDDSLGLPCAEDADCSLPASDIDTDVDLAGSHVPLGVIATSVCARAVEPRSVTPWPTEAILSASPAPETRVLRCVRTRDASSGLFVAAWSTTAAAFQAAAASAAETLPGLYLACLESPSVTSASFSAAALRLTVAFSLPTNKPTVHPADVVAGLASLASAFTSLSLAPAPSAADDPSRPSASTCSALLGPVSLAAAGGSDALCWWNQDGTVLLLTPGRRSTSEIVSGPLHLRAGVVGVSPLLYENLFNNQSMSALSITDLSGASTATMAATAIPVAVEAPVPLMLLVTAGKFAEPGRSYRVSVTAASGGVSRPLSVAYTLEVGAPDTITTAGDASVFASAVSSYLARWLPPGALDDAYDGRSEAVALLGSAVSALTPGQHQLRVVADTWLGSSGAAPVSATHLFTVSSTRILHLAITAAGASTDTPDPSPGLFDPGQALMVEVAVHPSGDANNLEAQWTVTPDPGASDAVGAGALATPRTLIFPPNFFAPGVRYALTLRVIEHRSLESDLEATATVEVESRSFPLVAILGVDNHARLADGAGVSQPSVAHRTAPSVLTPAEAQRLVASGAVSLLSTVALSVLPTLVPVSSDPTFVFDATRSYDPNAPRASAGWMAPIVSWSCHRVLRLAPALAGSSVSYESRACNQVAVGSAEAFSSAAQRLTMSRALVAALGPFVTDGSQFVTLVISATVRPSDSADPRRSQAIFAVDIVPTPIFSISVGYVRPLVGAIGADVSAALAARVGEDPSSQSWAAIPLLAPLRLRATVNAPRRQWALRWVCDDCGSSLVTGAPPPRSLDLSNAAEMLSTAFSDVLAVDATALSPNARYSFRVGLYALPSSSPSFPGAAPPPLSDGDDPLKNATMTAAFTVYTPSVPYAGFCGYETLDPVEDGLFNVRLFCRGWQNADGGVSPFSYRWGYAARASANPVDMLLAVTEGAAASAGEVNLALAPGTHNMTVVIGNSVGGIARVDIHNVYVPAAPEDGDPVEAAARHVAAASAALHRLDATGFVVASLSAALCVRPNASISTRSAAEQYSGVLALVSGMITQDETLWLLTTLENRERSLHATGDDTFVLATQNVSTLTGVELLAVTQAFALSNSSAPTPGDDPTAGFALLTALLPEESSVVIALHVASAALSKDVMTNLVDQNVPVTLSSGFAAASIVATYADVKTHVAAPTPGSEGVSVAHVLDGALAPVSAALLLEASPGEAPFVAAAQNLVISFARVDGRAATASDPSGWSVGADSIARTAFPFSNVGSGGAAPPPDATQEPRFWLPSDALADVYSGSERPLLSQPLYSVDVSFASRPGLAAALAGDAQHSSTRPPNGAIWTDSSRADSAQPRGLFTTATGLTLGQPGSPRAAVTVIPVSKLPRANSSAPAPPNSAVDHSLVWVSVSHEPAPTPLLGYFPYVAECWFFDVPTQSWSGEGCSVAAGADTRTWCKCSHLTVFSIRWSPSFLWPSFVRITSGTFGLLTAANLSEYPAPVSTISALVLFGLLLCVAFFFIDVRFDQEGLRELLDTWDPRHQRPKTLYDEFGLTPESSTLEFIWRRYIYVLRRDHLWCSLIWRPRTDNYSSQARAFAIMLMMLMTLLISGALYRSQRESAMLLTSFISALAVYPIVMVWHILFDRCNRDRLKRFVYRYAEEVAYLQLTGTSDFFPRSEWGGILSRRRREVDEVAELMADAGDWRVSPDDVEIVMAPRSRPHRPVSSSASTVVPSAVPLAQYAPNAKAADETSFPASAAVAAAMQHGYVVRQRPNTAFSLTRAVMNASCFSFCFHRSRSQQLQTLHRVSPLVRLDQSHPSYQRGPPSTSSMSRHISSRTPGLLGMSSIDGTKSDAAPGAVAGAVDVERGPPRHLGRVQVTSLIAFAGAGLPANGRATTHVAFDGDVERRQALVTAAFSGLNKPTTASPTAVDDAALPRRSLLLSSDFLRTETSSAALGSASTTLPDNNSDDFMPSVSRSPMARSSVADAIHHAQHLSTEVSHEPAPSLPSELSMIDGAPAAPSSLSALVVSTRSVSNVSLALADLSDKLALVRVPYDREMRRQRDRERLQFLLRYSIALDADHVGHTYRERAWEMSQPRGLRFLAVLVIGIGVAACLLVVLLIGLELDLGVETESDARRVSERWILATALSLGIYIVFSSPISTFVRSTVTYLVKGWARGRSRPSSASVAPLTSVDGQRAASARRATSQHDASFHDCGDVRFDGMPRPSSSRSFVLIDPRSSFFRRRPTSVSASASRSFSAASTRATVSARDAALPERSSPALPDEDSGDDGPSKSAHGSKSVPHRPCQIQKYPSSASYTSAPCLYIDPVHGLDDLENRPHDVTHSCVSHL